MFAMFHLGRPDVFPLGDLAVRKGLQELYELKVVYLSRCTMYSLNITYLKSQCLSSKKPLQARTKMCSMVVIH